MERLKYYCEKFYPYFFSFILTFMAYKHSIQFFENPNFKEILNGVVTLTSIILGFLGAIMPVIFSMKNESKFVQYVFQNDKNHLFESYLKATVFLGIMDATITLIMHVRDSLTEPSKEKLYYLWIFLTLAFLGATYRSMTCTIKLVFPRDDFDDQCEENSNSRKKSDEELELERKYNMNIDNK